MKRNSAIHKLAPVVPRPMVLGLAALMFALTAVLGACGGGVGSGGTGGFASGPITGFGSVIVNGVRFDNTSAQVTDGDGLARSNDDLKLGMTVEIDSNDITTDTSGNATAKASRIRYDSDLLGTVSAVDAAAGAFTVLGQKVVIDSTTVFAENLGALSALRAGQLVEVFAVFDPAAARYRATRVAAAASTAQSHVRGLVAQADGASQTLRIGDTTYSYTGASGVPANVSAGQYVRVAVSSQTNTSGRYAVQSFGTAVPVAPDSDQCNVKGLISSFVSSRSCSINGRPVDASGASFVSGTAGLGVGVSVEVKGSVSGGVLTATSVRIDSESEHSNQLFELHGSVTAVNAADKSFTMRGITVSTTRAGLVYQGGTAANVVVGRNLSVKGQLSSDGLRIEATSISFE